MLGERIYGSPLPPAHAPANTSPQQGANSDPLPTYAKDFPDDQKIKVEKLLDFAWHKGLSAAIKKVKKEDPLTIDMFHDAITDKLYEEFKRRKIL